MKQIAFVLLLMRFIAMGAESPEVRPSLAMGWDVGGGLQVSLQGREGWLFRLEQSTNLAGWDLFRTVLGRPDPVPVPISIDENRALFLRGVPVAIQVVPSTLALREGETGRFSVRLAAPPPPGVSTKVVLEAGSGVGNVRVEPGELTFGPGDSGVEQWVSVVTVADPDYEPTRVEIVLRFGSEEGASSVTGVRVHAADDDEESEWTGELSSWLNVRRDFGARGDGTNDDTLAIQAGLDALREGGGRGVLYFPAGIYRITRTLRMLRTGDEESRDIMVVGEDPRASRIRWDGPSGDPMLFYNGWYGAIQRLGFEGSGRAGAGITHGPLFSTYNDFSDLHFSDMVIGIEAGPPGGQGIAETTVRRCRFMRCSGEGIRIANHNTLDWFIWNSVFDGCARGVANPEQGGAFHIYGCLFTNSSICDVDIGNTGYMSIRHNTSIGSARFVRAAPVADTCLLTLQGNNVHDPRQTPVDVGNLGPLVLLDNRIESPAGSGTAVLVDWSAGFASVGNRFSSATPVVARPGSPSVDETVALQGLARELPALPGPPRVAARRRFVASPGDGAVAIQGLLDAAAGSGVGPSLVHLPAGLYLLDRPLLIRSNSNLHLSGDGGRTRLRWAGVGRGPMIRVEGKSDVLISHCALFGDGPTGRADGIVSTYPYGRDAWLQFDQLLVRGCERGVTVAGPGEAAVGFTSLYHEDNRMGIEVTGPAASTREGFGEVRVLGAAAANNVSSYGVRSGGRLLVWDAWYEAHPSRPGGFLSLADSGDFTLHGANIAPAASVPGEPAIRIEGHQGRVSLISTMFTFPGTSVSIRGDGREAQVLMLGTRTQTAGIVVGDPADALILESFEATGLGPSAIEGSTDWTAGELVRLLEQTRSVTLPRRGRLKEGGGSLRFHRVILTGMATGFLLGPGGLQ